MSQPATMSNSSARRFTWGWLVLLLYWAALVVGTHLPGDWIWGPEIEEEGAPGWSIPHFDKLVHAGGYFVLAGLTYWVYVSRRENTVKWLTLWLAVFSIHAVVDELTQALVPDRTPDLLDWISDTIGAACALALGAIYTCSRKSANSTM